MRWVGVGLALGVGRWAFGLTGRGMWLTTLDSSDIYSNVVGVLLALVERSSGSLFDTRGRVDYSDDRFHLYGTIIYALYVQSALGSHFGFGKVGVRVGLLRG